MIQTATYDQGLGFLRDSAAAKATADTTAQAPLPVADTTALAGGASDSLSMDLFGAADSMLLMPVEIPRWREGTEQEIFGTASYSVAGHNRFTTDDRPATDYPSFGFFIILLSLLYAVLLYSKANDIRQLFRSLSHRATTGKYLAANQRGGFSLFLNIIVFTAPLVIGIVFARLAEPIIPQWLYGVPPQFAALTAALLAAGASIAVIIYQRITLWIVGEITLTQQLVLQLRQEKSVYFTIQILILTPIGIFFAICPENLYSLWLGILVAGTAVALVLYLIAALRLFISEKISILLWFLYLCIVEIFPISLLWLLAVR